MQKAQCKSIWLVKRLGSRFWKGLNSLPRLESPTLNIPCSVSLMWWGLRATPGQLPKRYYLIPSVESRVTFVSADYHLLIQSSVWSYCCFPIVIFVLAFSIETEQIGYIYTSVYLKRLIIRYWLIWFLWRLQSPTIGHLQARHLAKPVM